MTTKVIKLSPKNPDPKAIANAVDVLKSGGLVCFPTETVYGLGADSFNVPAIQRLFEAKQRPSDNPLIVHVGDFREVSLFAGDIPPKAKTLAGQFWPGPLTLVLQGKETVPDIVRAGLRTVALRVPNHAVALALIREFGSGVVAPSANLSGRPSPTTAAHVLDDLRGKVDLILDAGSTEIGIESTVLDVTVDPPVILREGGLTREQIEQMIGPVRSTDSMELLKRSPGTRHRHYAPRAKLMIVGSTMEIESIAKSGKKIGVIFHSFEPSSFEAKNARKLSADVKKFAHDIFDAIRELDEKGVDVILVEQVKERGIGVAVMQRLRKGEE